MRVLIADDHPLITESLRRLLTKSPGFQVVGEATTGAEVLPLVRRTVPDVVLLDLRLPQTDGFTVLDQIRRAHPRVKVVILSASTDPVVVERALARGASAYIVKSVEPVDLPATLREVVQGNVFHAPGREPVQTANRAAEAAFSDRELAILRALAQGLPNSAIAKQEFISEATVKFHLTKIYRKLDVSNRTEAARVAHRTGLANSV